MRDIVVAGGAGFIGSHFVDRLLTRQDCKSIVVVDNLWTGRKNNLAHISDKRLTFIESDIETVGDIGQFDEVYHFASPASPPWYTTDPIRTVRANVLGAMRLLELLRPRGVICFTSTSEVYGDPLVSPQPEFYRGSVDCTGPRSSYDESKRCVESILFESRRVYGTQIRVVRLFNVFGPRVRPEDGRAVSNFIAQALRGEPITVYGDGLQTRSWGFIDDIIEGLDRFFCRQHGDFPGPLNIGNDREVSVIALAEYIHTRFPKSAIIHLPPAVQDPTNRKPDLTLARRYLSNWSCKTPYELGIDRTIAWFQQHEDVTAQIAPPALLENEAFDLGAAVTR